MTRESNNKRTWSRWTWNLTPVAIPSSIAKFAAELLMDGASPERVHQMIVEAAEERYRQ